jgi:4-amino-4-deoxy-L-arabinose transferase-like glycosyltransferase
MSARLKYILIAFLAILLFVPNLGLMPLFDWFEMGFADAAKEMASTGNFFTISIGGKPYIGFQPLFIWMQAISMKVFGINEFAARFPNAMCGVVTLLVLFFIGKRLVNERFGLIWILFYAASLIPLYFFKTGMTDPWHNLFVFVGIFCVYEFFLSANRKRKDFLICCAAFFFGLAFLVNGFWSWIILVFCLIFYAIVKMFNVKIQVKHAALFLAVLLLVSITWLVIALFNGNTGYVLACYKFQIHRALAMHSGREGFFPYYVILVIMGVFPSSILAFNIIKKQRKDDREPLHEFRNWMMILFLVILGLQLLMRPRISNYSTLAFIPLTFFATYVVSKLHELKQDLPKWTARLVLLVGVLSGVTVIGIEIIHHYKDFVLSIGFLSNVFFREAFQANVEVNGVMLIAGIVYISGILTFFMLGKFSFFTKLTGVLVLTILFNYLTFLFILPHVQEYKQGTLISFYKEKKAEDCYIVPVGFTSYGQYFYGNKQRSASLKAIINNNHKVETKPVYFIYKINEKADLINKLGRIEQVKQENGYIFAKRLNQQHDLQ